MKIKSLSNLAAMSVIAITAMAMFTSPASAAGYACFADSSQICAPITAVTFTTNGVHSSVTSGLASANLAANRFDFTFRSDANSAGKTLTVHFFDITSGMHLLPVIGDSNASTGCAASGATGKNCVIKTNSSGSATFSISILDSAIGKAFSYQIMGPAGFASNAVNVMFTKTGSNVQPAGTCSADRMKLCTAISNVGMTLSGKNVKVTFTSDGTGTAKVGTSTSLVDFNYSSSSDYAYKWAFIKFLNISSGLTISLDAGDPTLSTACDAQDANFNGCRIRLDANGSATFMVSLSGNQIGRTFQYELSGPSYDSKTVTVGFAAAPIFSANNGSIATAAITGATSMVKVVVAKAKGQKVTVVVGSSAKVSFVPSSNLESFYFPRAKGSVKVVVAIGTTNITKTVKVT
jgi:hypothetical protein